MCWEHALFFPMQTSHQQSIVILPKAPRSPNRVIKAVLDPFWYCVQRYQFRHYSHHAGFLSTKAQRCSSLPVIQNISCRFLEMQKSQRSWAIRVDGLEQECNGSYQRVGARNEMPLYVKNGESWRWRARNHLGSFNEQPSVLQSFWLSTRIMKYRRTGTMIKL